MEYKVFSVLDKTHNMRTMPLEEKVLNTENLFPFNADTAVIVTSHKGHIPYLRYSLGQYRQIPSMFVLGAYDSREVTPYSKDMFCFPHPDIWSLAHMWVTKHYTWGGHQKRHGWLWLHIYASSIIRNFPNIKYIFSANGDCVWDKPEGLPEIIDILGSNDFMSGQSMTRDDGFNFIHSCSMVFKRDGYFSFIDYMISKVRESTTASWSPEDLLQMWVKECDVVWEHAPVQPFLPDGTWDNYCEANGDSTWKEVLGFRNLEAEKNWSSANEKEPFDKKYMDLEHETYFKDHDKNTLLKYYLTGDSKWKKKWWDLNTWQERDVRLEKMTHY